MRDVSLGDYGLAWPVSLSSRTVFSRSASMASSSARVIVIFSSGEGAVAGGSS